MLQITQSYTLTDRGWLPGTLDVYDPAKDSNWVRSYDGAYFGERAKRQLIQWEQETVPTYDEILAKGPVNTISQFVLRQEEDRLRTQHALEDPKLAVAHQRRSTRMLLWGSLLLLIAFAIGVAIPWLYLLQD